MATPGDDLVGRVLAGRYLLLQLIGTGASGRVYAADDLQLRRRVAVKVLHDALAGDAGFLARFRAEAQVAASLRHPHIMVVHDFLGDDTDMPFIVMELLAGGSLRGVLDSGTRLSLAQAAQLGRAVASALDYAHRNGVIHRDIKPANLLFDEQGDVRIADFGLARALAEASWTEPMGAMFGTARYASPEQALGVQLDYRSDLYALALVIIESVTGELPWTADTPIGLLTVRTRASIVVDASFGPLRAVLERCGRLDRDERYPDAATLVRALDDAIDALPSAVPFELPGVVEATDADPTTHVAMPAVAPIVAPGITPGITPDSTAAEPAVPPPFDQDQAGHSTDPGATGVAPAIAPVVAVESSSAENAALPPVMVRNDPRSPRNRFRRRAVTTFVAIALLAALVGAVVAVAGLFAAPGHAVPGFVGYASSEARARAERAGLHVSTESRTSDDPAGTVISQSPAAGSLQRDGSDVHFVVSSGPAKVTVPSLLGQPAAAAAAQLVARGLIGRPSHAFDDTNPSSKGSVISSPRDGQLVVPDTEIAYVVSDGHHPVKIPVLTNLTYAQAAAKLQALGFVAQRGPDAFSTPVPAGSVIGTTPAANSSQDYGSTVTIVVSKGPDLVTMPDVVGLQVGPACKLVRNQGLGCKVTGTLVTGNVASTSVRGGAQVPRGTEITVVVS